MVAREKDKGRDREFRVDMYTLLYLKWIGNKDLLYSTWNSAQCYAAAWIEGEFGIVMYILLSSKWITNKDLLYSTWNSAQCYVAAWMGGGLREMDTYMCRAESLCCSPETSTALSIGYKPKQN